MHSVFPCSLGESIDERDGASAPRVCVVNANMAAVFWRSE